jgi:glutamate dehydrogenase/leucine dehydrogenase
VGLQVDIFSPNAIAGVVTVDVAKRLKAKAIVGAANVPFRSEEARTIAADRGIFFVPEYITSAGAIIVDSMEWCHDDWATLRPSVAYAFCYDMVYAKVHVPAHRLVCSRHRWNKHALVCGCCCAALSRLVTFT